MDDRRFAEALLASRPCDEIPVEQRIFEPLIGSWDLVVDWYEDGRHLRSMNGEWHFSRVLEGRAIQDVWIVPPRSERGNHPHNYEYGTSLRFYDAAIAGWRSTWVGPVRGVVMRFIARRIGDRIVLQDPDEHGYRWTFSEVREESFRWSNELRLANGEWQLQQTFQASRMRA